MSPARERVPARFPDAGYGTPHRRGRDKPAQQSRLEAQMSDDFPVTPAGDPTQNLKIDGGDSSGNGLPLAHQGVPHILAAPGHPTIVPYTVCAGKAPGRTRDITRRSGIGFRPDPGREAQMVNKPPAPGKPQPGHRLLSRCEAQQAGAVSGTTGHATGRKLPVAHLGTGPGAQRDQALPGRTQA